MCLWLAWDLGPEIPKTWFYSFLFNIRRWMIVWIGIELKAQGQCAINLQFNFANRDGIEISCDWSYKKQGMINWEKWTDGNFWKAATKLLLFFSTFSFRDDNKNESIKKRQGIKTFQPSYSTVISRLNRGLATGDELRQMDMTPFKQTIGGDAGCWGCGFTYIVNGSGFMGRPKTKMRLITGCFVSRTIRTFPILFDVVFAPTTYKYIFSPKRRCFLQCEHSSDDLVESRWGGVWW